MASLTKAEADLLIEALQQHTGPVTELKLHLLEKIPRMANLKTTVWEREREEAKTPLPTPADNGSSRDPSRTAGSAPLEDSFRDAGQVGSKGATR